MILLGNVTSYSNFEQLIPFGAILTTIRLFKPKDEHDWILKETVSKEI